jgi:3-phosphoshikimate 1-carboxyvinyltransferase
MNIQILPTNKLNGEIIAPGSKSYSHRAFIAASLANKPSTIKYALDVGDVGITLKVLKLLGVNLVKMQENTYKVESGINFHLEEQIVLDCENSGSTIRFFAALSLLFENGIELKGEFFKRKRPIIPLLNALTSLRGNYELYPDSVFIRREGETCKRIKIPGNISSQFISALLLVTPIINCKKNNDDLEIEVTSSIVSYPYIEITIDVLKSFGIEIEININQNNLPIFHIPSRQEYKAIDYVVPGDFSSIAFIIAAGVLTHQDSLIKIYNLDFNSCQGDKRFIAILKDMGADIEVNKKKQSLVIRGGILKNPLVGKEIDVKDTPDLFPILSVIGMFASGKTVLFNASNLRLKESDRIKVMASQLKKMGVNVEEQKDSLTIYHCDNPDGIDIEHENDHRIAMSLIIAALNINSISSLTNVEIVNDSYPNFLKDMINLGAGIEIIKN